MSFYLADDEIGNSSIDLLGKRCSYPGLKTKSCWKYVEPFTELSTFKDIVHPKIQILSLMTHPHVVPNPYDQIKIYLIKSDPADSNVTEIPDSESQ